MAKAEGKKGGLMETSKVIELILAFVSGINLPVIVLLYRRLGQIRDSIDLQNKYSNIQNGRLAHLEEWRIGHDKWAAEQKQRIDDLDERCLGVLTRQGHIPIK